MASRMQFGFDLGRQSASVARTRDDDAPFRILLIGDFSGHTGRPGDAPARQSAPLRIDVDRFDQVIAKLAPAVAIVSDTDIPIAITALDAFHPDHLLRTLPAFSHLRELRARLQDPARFAAAAAELGAGVPSRPASPGASASAPETDDSLLGRLLGRAPAESTAAPRGATARSALDAIIQAAVAPHVVPDPGLQHQAQYLAAVDASLAELLRKILHAPAFQTLEATWRGVHWLVDQLDPDASLQVHLLDMTQDELRADAALVASDPPRSVLHRVIAEKSATGDASEAWSLIVPLFDVAAHEDDIAWLAALAACGARAGAPTIATAAPSMLGLPRFDPLPDPRDWPDVATVPFWDELRASPLAPWIGLAAPRLLMRRPYGVKSDPVEGMPFEEMDGAHAHDALLWAPAALGCAALLGQSFRENGWQMQAGDHLQIGNLPTCMVTRDGDRQLQPCAEVLLSERAAAAMGERGVMAMASYKDRAEVRLVRFQSIAQPARALSGFGAG